MVKTKVSSATSRLKQDYLRLKSDPVPYVSAEPVPSNILEWHYVVRGPEKTPYEGGYYHGKIVFPSDFPFRPPAIYMLTPNGRFKINTRLCLSITDFHPDTWNPAWSVSTILTGLLSFMLETTPTMGSTESSESNKRCMAAESLEVNMKNAMFCELFPEITQEIEQELTRRRESQSADSDRNDLPNGHAAGTGDQSSLNYVITHVCAILGFVGFVWMVKYVIRTHSEE